MICIEKLIALAKKKVSSKQGVSEINMIPYCKLFVNMVDNMLVRTENYVLESRRQIKLSSLKSAKWHCAAS